ncbi:hypothetical protein KAZ66_04085 [Candidatus Woesebacteria bacterium]|nr:hypothetical protein [Candidatus Woesebacteria bacterium]
MTQLLENPQQGQPTYEIGGINTYEVYEKVDRSLQNVTSEELPNLIQAQIQAVADRRNGGVRKTQAAIEENLFRNDPTGKDGYKKAGEIGELIEVLKQHGHIPRYTSIAPEGEDIQLNMQELMAQMYDIADTDKTFDYDAADTSEATLPDRAMKSVLATTAILDEVADSVYYLHYHGDEILMTEKMLQLEEMTGLSADALRKLALIKYSIRNEYSDSMKSGNKTLDKKNRKGLEQAVMAQYIWHHKDEMLIPYKLNAAEATQQVEHIQSTYAEAQAEKLREIPIAESLMTDMACTLVNLEAHFEEIHGIIAQDFNTTWTHEQQEDLEANLRMARSAGRTVSRLQIMLEMMGQPVDEQSIEMLRTQRDNLLLETIRKAAVIELQDGAQELIEKKFDEGKPVYVYTGLEDEIVNALKEKLPVLQKTEIILRQRGQKDQEVLGALKSSGNVDFSEITAIFDAPSHIFAALKAGIGGEKYRIFYRPGDQYPNLEAQALSFGIKDQAEHRKVVEIRSLNDVLAAMNVQRSVVTEIASQ